MGQAKRRRQEIDRLKAAGPMVDPRDSDPAALVDFTRRLAGLAETARARGDLAPVMAFLHAKTEETLGALPQGRLACAMGCSHCCHTWVSATAPEILTVASIVAARGAEAAEAVARAHEATGRHDFETRVDHPYPCPLLKDDLCSVYEARPRACRIAVSADAEICARAYLEGSGEGIPRPSRFVTAGLMFSTGLAAALKRAGLPWRSYEFNAGLSRALETPDAAARWLAGEDVFEGVPMDPRDVLGEDWSGKFYRMAFG